MERPSRLRPTRLVQRDGSETVDFEIVNASHHPLSDLFYTLVRTSWPRLLLAIAAIYLGINAVFACVYAFAGGIEGAREGSLVDGFFFSVQTMATIGYGAMHPRTPLANALVTLEAGIGLLGVAMSTGVLFSKFARPVARLVFSRVAVVSTRDGKPSLMFRVGNERLNHVVEASMRVNIVRNELTAEGEQVRRWYEVPLLRATSPVFALTWTAIHVIDEASPLWKQSRESLEEARAEMVITFTGLDVTLSTTIHARHSFVADEIVWGARFVDILTLRPEPEAKRRIDFGKFHDVMEAPLELPWKA